MTTHTALELRWDGQAAGSLQFDGPECWRFRPKTDVNVIPSWSGLQRVQGMHDNRRAWCRHLLPDAAECAELSRRLGVSVGNEFALLGLRGLDCRGAVGFGRPDSPPAPTEAWREMTAAERGGFATVARGGRLPEVASEWCGLVPGPAGRVACRVRESDHAPLLGNGLASHLASAGRAGFVEGLENEALCMELAAALALPVPSALLLEGAPTLLLTARPDRLVDPRGGVHRRHVESLPQVAGLHPEFAFEREGGLSLRDCVELLRRHSVAPAPDVRHLLRWVVFCFLTGIGEGHARTLLLVASNEGPRLAIDGGLVSTHLDAAQSDRLALSIGGEDRPDWLRLARWVDLADDLGIGRRYLLDLVAGVATELPALAARVVAERPCLARSRATVPRLLRLVANRARQTRIALTAEGRGAFDARGGQDSPALRDPPPAKPA